MRWFAQRVASRLLLVLLLPFMVGAFLYLHFVVEFSNAMWLRVLSAVIAGAGAAGVTCVGLIVVSLPFLALIYFAGRTRFVVTPTAWRLERFIAGLRVRCHRGDTASVKLASESHTVRNAGRVRSNFGSGYNTMNVSRKVIHRLAFRDADGNVTLGFGVVLSREERRFVRKPYDALVFGKKLEWPANMNPWRPATAPEWLALEM